MWVALGTDQRVIDRAVNSCLDPTTFAAPARSSSLAQAAAPLGVGVGVPSEALTIVPADPSYGGK